MINVLSVRLSVRSTTGCKTHTVVVEGGCGNVAVRIKRGARPGWLWNARSQRGRAATAGPVPRAKWSLHQHALASVFILESYQYKADRW